MQIDLRAAGFDCDFEAHGTVQEAWLGGSRLLFVFGESHSDQAMIRLNVLNACALYDLGIVHCAATEVPFNDQLTDDVIARRSQFLFEENQEDESAIRAIRQNFRLYGRFKFGDTLRLLRPSIAMHWVEDAELREKMDGVMDLYEKHALITGSQHPFPEYPRVEDHPLNIPREIAMINNTLGIWAKTCPTHAAILNTGSSHCCRIANELRKRQISHYLITQPSLA